MLKRILKSIGRRLLKIDWFKREVEAYKFEQEKQKSRERWAKIMKSGQTVHADDSKIIVDYTDGRMLGQRHVTPLFIDSTNWGVRNSEDPLLHVCSSDRTNAESSSSEGNGKTNINYARNYARTNASNGPCSTE